MWICITRSIPNEHQKLAQSTSHKYHNISDFLIMVDWTSLSTLGVTTPSQQVETLNIGMLIKLHFSQSLITQPTLLTATRSLIMRLPLLNSAWNPAFWKTCFKSDSFGSLKNIALCGGILLVGNLLRDGTWPAARAASLLATIQKDMCNMKGVLTV